MGLFQKDYIHCYLVTMVPKIVCQQKINYFRPISLVGCLYKIVIKILEGRLKVILNSVISYSQYAFLEGRQILDCIVVLNEVVDEAKRARNSYLLFKADFEKAYDLFS
jgi:hypothetical protein